MSLIPDAERVLSELVQFKGSLQKEENKHRVKIQNERTALEKIAIRQGFYKVRIFTIYSTIVSSSLNNTIIIMKPETSTEHRPKTR